MRRRHKAQYDAHERAHLAPSVPHVRRDRSLPGAQPGPVQPTPLHLRRKQLFHPKAPETKMRASFNFQVPDTLELGITSSLHLSSLDSDGEPSDVGSAQDHVSPKYSGGKAQVL